VIIKYKVDNKMFSGLVIPDAELEIQNDRRHAQKEHSFGG
jgi:hypothetical protein